MKMTARTAIDIALVGVATLLRLDDRAARVGEARIVLGAVAPTPIRARKAEASIKGHAMDDQLLERAARTAAEETQPISDVRGSAEYRREMVKVLTKRALKKTLKIISEKREEK
jgi:carbon-monoxide dehydrogenase medium subunit